MRNFAREHFQKHCAKAAAEQAAEFGAMQDMTAFELQMVQLNNDRQRLKQIASTAAKVVLKKALLPNHLPYVEGIIEADKSIQDEVFMTMLVWCIDVGDYAKALQLTEFALRHNMIMPDSFKRNTATYVVETIAEAFLKQLKTNADVEVSVLWKLESILENFSNETLNMPDQVSAKLNVAAGKAELKYIKAEIDRNQGQIDAFTPEWVLHHSQHAKMRFEQALLLDEKCGCRADLKAIEKILEQVIPVFKEFHKQPEPLLNSDGSQVVDDQGNLVFKTTE